MTATEASRKFAELLDLVESGEVVVITRGGRRVARITGAERANGRALKDLLRRFPPDLDWEADVLATRGAVLDSEEQWHG